jgi:hypothetical protein
VQAEPGPAPAVQAEPGPAPAVQAEPGPAPAVGAEPDPVGEAQAGPATVEADVRPTGPDSTHAGPDEPQLEPGTDRQN